MKKLTKKFLAFAYNVLRYVNVASPNKHEVGRGNKKENFSGEDFITRYCKYGYSYYRIMD